MVGIDAVHSENIYIVDDLTVFGIILVYVSKCICKMKMCAIACARVTFTEIVPVALGDPCFLIAWAQRMDGGGMNDRKQNTS